MLFRSLMKDEGKLWTLKFEEFFAQPIYRVTVIIYKGAMNLASDRGADLMVIHVISQRSIKAAKALAYYLNDSQNDVVKEKTYSALQRMKKQLGSFLKKEIKDHPESPGLDEHLLVYPGKVAEEIVEKANRFGCETIVLGPHGSSFYSAFFSWGTT
ncbi:MAG: universal stress protein [Desulfobacterales bacterium]|nr:MAG: universal stress protein [Desulfobacterales bacterium]